ncbi:hypothetical protein BDQ17DRAFT_1546801 [Cyathus striatus]|nr:hypothetical protein BDQ17DRAFT_1546801 [Cyathus striatus]
MFTNSFLFFVFFPSALGRSTKRGSVLSSHGADGRSHVISVTGKTPRAFEMSYVISPGTTDTASFVIDGIHFNFASPSTKAFDTEASDLPDSNCNDIEQFSVDRNIHVSFSGEQVIPAVTNAQLYGSTFTQSSCECTGFQSILLDALIRGLGIVLIFICVWILLRWFIDNNHHPRLRTSSRSKLRMSSRAPSIHESDPARASKEYKDSGILTSPVIVPGDIDTREEAHSTHAAPVSVKRDSATPTKKNAPLPPEPSEHGSVSDDSRSSLHAGNNRGLQSPVSVAPQAFSSPPQAKWTPHTDVSKVNAFAATPAILLPEERNLTPPPPPPRTIPNYNPVLGLPRPANIEKILQVYDFIFLIDDSGSMYGSSWSEARESVNKLANWTLDNGWDRDGITLRFLNSDRLFRFQDLNGISDKNKIRQLVNVVRPKVEHRLGNLEKAKHTPEYTKIRPLILVVITDGAPTDGYEYQLSRVLMSISIRLAACCHHPNSLAVQFVQVGGDPTAAQALKVLTQLNTDGMVDAISSADLGSLSPDKLSQLMLGGVHPNVRAKGISSIHDSLSFSSLIHNLSLDQSLP